MTAIARATILLVSLFAVMTARADWVRREETIMGTRIYVELWHDNPVVGEQAIDAVMDDMRRIDALMSHYKPESELSRINREAFGQPIAVTPELYQILEECFRLSAETGGAFDVTVGPLM